MRLLVTPTLALLSASVLGVDFQLAGTGLTDPHTELEGRYELPEEDPYPTPTECQIYDAESGEMKDSYYFKECTICPGWMYTKWDSKTFCPDGWEVVEVGTCRIELTFNIAKGCKAYCRSNEIILDYGCGCGNGTDCLDVDCEMTEWSSWSKCLRRDDKTEITCDEDAPLTSGVQIRTRSVKAQEQYGGAECSSFSTSEHRSCNSHTCVDYDCKVSAWSAWSTCDRSCGGGSQTRTRSVTQKAQNNGAACPALSQTRACNTDYCYNFKLKGYAGDESVLVIEGWDETPTTSEGATFLLDSATYLGTNNPKVTLKWQKYNKKQNNRGVYFSFTKSPSQGLQSGGMIYFPAKWEDWKCGRNDEHSNCATVRAGKFKWEGIYAIQFLELKN